MPRVDSKWFARPWAIDLAPWEEPRTEAEAEAMEAAYQNLGVKLALAKAAGVSVLAGRVGRPFTEWIWDAPRRCCEVCHQEMLGGKCCI